MTGDAILNATYGIIPRNVKDKYISRSSRLLHLVTESTKRGYFLGVYFGDPSSHTTRVDIDDPS
jgi:hypothetical protein